MLATKKVTAGSRGKQVRVVPASSKRSKLRRAFRRKSAPSALRVKLTAISTALGVPKDRKLERRLALSLNAKTKGSHRKLAVSNTKSVLGVSPCAPRLDAKLKLNRKKSITGLSKSKSGLSVDITATINSRGSLQLDLRSRYSKALWLKSKRLYKADLSVDANRAKTVKLKLKRSLARKLARSAKRRRVKSIKAKLTITLKGAEGQRVREAVTIKLMCSR